MKINKLAKWLHSGTFDRNKHRREYRDHKFDREIDIFISYLYQLPYLKLIGIPMALLITLIQWSPVIFWITVESIKNKILKH